MPAHKTFRGLSRAMDGGLVQERYSGKRMIREDVKGEQDIADFSISRLLLAGQVSFGSASIPMDSDKKASARCSKGHVQEEEGNPARFPHSIPFSRPYLPRTAAIWKMGRYMAMTNAPMADPRKTIKRGSRSEVRADTAASTSSS